MRYSKLVIPVFGIWSCLTFGQQSTDQETITEPLLKTENYSTAYSNIQFQSKILEDTQTVKVYLPNGYSENKKYPVIYVTDAKYNFETAVTYADQLMKFDNIPECILVGIEHNNRNDELDVFWSEKGIKFKDFIFKELVPNIDTNYATSGFNTIIGHSDGAEYNHLLMLQAENPFRGFINLSENLNTDVTENNAKFFKTYTNKPLFYYIGSASYDSTDRIDAGISIENNYKEHPNALITFKNQLFDADHENLISLALIDGIKFVFQKYRNAKGYDNFKEFADDYQATIETDYGIKISLNDNDIDYFFGNILDAKDLEMYEYLIDYTQRENIFQSNSLDRANHYFYMDQYLQAITFWNKTIDEFNNISPRVFYFNFNKAILAYEKLEQPENAIVFLQKAIKKMPEYQLEFSYFIAKTALENNINKKLGKSNLKYCQLNFKENKYFKLEDLDKLSKI